MSVMACNRYGCENIMCARYSLFYGYLCDECFEELKASNKPVEVFMRSAKGTYIKQTSIYDYEGEFPLQ